MWSNRQSIKIIGFQLYELNKNPFCCGASGENCEMRHPVHGVHGAEDSVRLLLTKTPPAPSVAPVPGPRYLVWTVPVVLAENYNLLDFDVCHLSIKNLSW